MSFLKWVLGSFYKERGAIDKLEKTIEGIVVKSKAFFLKKKALNSNIPKLLYNLYLEIYYYSPKENGLEYGLKGFKKIEDEEINNHKCKRVQFEYNENRYILATCDYNSYIDFGDSIDHRYIHLFFNDKKVVSLDFNKFNYSDRDPYDTDEQYECDSEDDVKGFIEGPWVKELKLLEKNICIVKKQKQQKNEKIYSQKETKDLKENFEIE